MVHTDISLVVLVRLEVFILIMHAHSTLVFYLVNWNATKQNIFRQRDTLLRVSHMHNRSTPVTLIYFVRHLFFLT